MNNRIEEFEAASMTVSEMLEARKFSFRMRIVKINGRFIRKEDYDTEKIQDGDNVQMLYLMSGG
ncbi:MAG: sulfur carrier protein ThiS [Bacteroidales bacterium]